MLRNPRDVLTVSDPDSALERNGNGSVGGHCRCKRSRWHPLSHGTCKDEIAMVSMPLQQEMNRRENLLEWI